MAVDDSYTKSLLHFDNNFTDGSGKVWTVSGAITSSTKSKFGGYSAYFDGTDDGIVCADTSLPGYFGIGKNATIDFWVCPTAFGSARGIVSIGDGSWAGVIIDLTTTGIINLKTYTGTNANPILSSTSSLSLNTFSHIAVVFNNNVKSLYVNGVLQASTTISTMAMSTDNRIGNYRSMNWFIGYIDEFRVSNIARWTSNFTPPTAPYGPIILPPKKNIIHPSLLSTSIGQK